MQAEDKEHNEVAEEPNKVFFKKSSRKNLRQRKNSEDGDEEQ